MLKTGASLVVAAVGSAEVGEEGYYPNIDAQQIASRRSSTTNGRKRKRRPQASTSEDDNAEYDSKQYWRGHVDDDVIHKAGNAKDVNVNTKTRRRKQPAIREPLAALEKEQKLYEMRDRQRQENEEIDGTKSHDKSYRRPYAQAKKEFYNSTPTSIGIDLAESKTATDLKHILKNSGGLSLSEILQQKNLSLDDLLKGKQNALLALQTTAASPNISAGDASASTHQKAENFNHLKPARRIPTTYLGDRSSEVNADSGERVSSEDTPAGKNKLKFPALQRLKLFGTSSRVTAIPLPGSGEVVTKKRIPSGSTTSTTSTITTTSRLPIYKKRTQQRPTLKPPGLFKATISTTPQAAQATKEMPTSKEISTTTKSIEEAEPVEIIDTLKEKHNDNVKLQVKELEDNMSAEQSENYDATTEHNSVNITTPTEVATASTILQTSVSSTTTSTTAAATTTATVNSSSRRHKFAANPRQRVKSKFRERINGNNLKSNFIEQNEAQLIQTNSEHSNESKETIKNSFEEDDLENFFEEVSKEAKLEAEEMQTTIESITARIDRTRNNKESNSLSPFLSSSKITTSSEESLPDFDGIDDRTDLLELIEDRRSGNRLFKILQQRNMTLDELIEHRKRGSSQLHLATIVEQNARSQFFPGQKVVLHDNMDIVTAFENFPHFNLLNIKSVKPDDIKTDSQGSSYFTSIIDIEPTDDAFKKIGADIIDGVGDGNLRGALLGNRLERQQRFYRGAAKFHSDSFRN